MNETWLRMIKNYIESYEAIVTLIKNHVINEDSADALYFSLLKDIIDTFKSEVEG